MCVRETCFTFFGWMFQLATWTFLILSIFEKKIYIFIIFNVVYLIYIILEFCSPLAQFLHQKNSAEGI